MRSLPMSVPTSPDEPQAPLPGTRSERPDQHAPVDFGTHRKAILRSLDLNSRLLHEPELSVDEDAMLAKIDELLDRLNDLD